MDNDGGGKGGRNDEESSHSRQDRPIIRTLAYGVMTTTLTSDLSQANPSLDVLRREHPLVHPLGIFHDGPILPQELHGPFPAPSTTHRRM